MGSHEAVGISLGYVWSITERIARSRRPEHAGTANLGAKDVQDHALSSIFATVVSADADSASASVSICASLDISKS